MKLTNKNQVKKFLSLILTGMMLFGLFAGIPVSANDYISTESEFSTIDEWWIENVPIYGGERPAITAGLSSELTPQYGANDNFIAPIDNIEDESQWIPISNRIQLESIENDLSGKYYLTNDIDLGDAEWVPIGNSGNPFTGTFDGQGYVIKNLKIGTASTPKNIQYAGLFGYVANATIKNVGLEGTVINTAFSSYNYSYAGGIFGYGDGVSVKNCYNTGNITATAGYYYAFVGGIGGYLTGTTGVSISDCYNTGVVSAGTSSLSSYYYHVYAGGILGYISVTGNTAISNCFNTGVVSASTTVTSYAYAGGIFGYSANSISISNCYNTGVVSASTSISSTSYAYAGGIFGYSNNSISISNCYNTGDVSAEATTTTSSSAYAYAGGISGYGIGITNCYNTGNVLATAKASVSDSSSAYAYAGGISGYGVGIIDCYNTGDVSAEANYASSYAGGICGFLASSSGVSISKCYNEGTISASASSTSSNVYAGGIFGYNNSNKIIIYSCYNMGDVTASSSSSSSDSVYAGGICGRGYYDITISNCYNMGNVTASSSSFSSSDSRAGGLFGYVNAVTMSNCYNKGTVSALSRTDSANTAVAYAGGLFGYIDYSSNTIVQSYNAGNIAVSSYSHYAAAASAYAGGICGRGDYYNNSLPSFVNCYWNTDITYTVKLNNVEQKVSKKGVGHTTYVKDVTTPLTAKQMESKGAFRGFDFDLIWSFSKGDYKYPVLRTFHDDDELIEYQEITDDFTDPNFLAAVRKIVDKPTEPIYDIDVENIENLDVRGLEIASLAGIQHFIALQTLDCGDNQLTKLDISANFALTELKCNNNQLTEFDVSNNTELTTLDCGDNQLTKLDISTHLALTELKCNNNQLTEFDVSNNTELTTFDCSNNKLTSLSLHSWNYTNLENLNCSNNQLSSLDTSYSNALTTLDCSNNKLTSLDTSCNNALTTLDCSNNQLSSLNLYYNSNLTYLNCSRNSMHYTDYVYNWSNISGLILGDTFIFYYQNISHTVTFNATSGGEVSASANDNDIMSGSSVLSGSDVIFTATPKAGYYLKGWQISVDGESYTDLSGETSFTAESIKTSISVTVEFERISVDITDDFKDANFLAAVQLLLGKTSVSRIYNTDVENTTYLNVSSKNIADLSGIEHFTALTTLYCYDNQLTALDVSNNTALTSLDCGSNPLTALDVSNNTALTQLTCNSNELTALDVSNNTSLTYLNCEYNELTALDVSNNTALTTLYCYYNQLTTLDVSNNTALTWLNCQYNNMKSTDNVIGWQSIGLFLNSNFFFNPQNDLIDSYIVTFSAIGSGTLAATADGAGITSGSIVDENIPVTFTATPNSYLFRIKEWKIFNGTDSVYHSAENTTYSVDSVTKALTVTVEFEKIPTDITDDFKDANFLAAVQSLLGKTSGSRIYNTDVENIAYLDVSNKNIADLSGIEHFTALTTLYCYSNQLTALDMSNNTALTTLYCYENQLTALDVWNNTALTTLYCYENQLTALDVWNNTALTLLYCHSNELTALDVSNNTALTGLGCGYNQLTALDVWNNTELTWLDCYSNKLTALDVWNNTALTWLSCGYNQLTALDISNNTALTGLDCRVNQLTELDVSNNTALTWLICQSNNMKSTDYVIGWQSIGLVLDSNFYFNPQNDIKTTYPVTFSVIGSNSNGTIKATVDGTDILSGAQVEDGKEVIFSASPAYGYRVMEWGIDYNEEEINNPSDSGEYLRIPNLTKAITVTVEFELIPQHTLTTSVNNADFGTASANPTTAPEGNIITLTADAKSGYVFDYWQVVSGIIEINDLTLRETTFTMPDSDVEIRAIFKLMAKDNTLIEKEDHWNFTNSSTNFNRDYWMSDAFYSTLLSSLSNTERTSAERMRYNSWGGSCYGMSVTTILAKANIFKVPDWESSAENIYQLNKTRGDKNESLINYYQILQVSSKVQQAITQTISTQNEAQKVQTLIELASNVKNGGAPVLLCYFKQNWGGHAVVAYGVEYGSWTWNGVTYGGRILINDPNTGGLDQLNYEKNTKERHLYFRPNALETWTIPGSGYNLRSASGAYIGLVTNDLSLINNKGYLTGATVIENNMDYISILEFVTNSKDYSIQKIKNDGHGGWVNSPTYEDEIKPFYDMSIDDEEESPQSTKFALKDSQSGYQIYLENLEKLDLSMTYEQSLLTANADKGKSVKFQPNGFIELESVDSDFEMSMTFNEGHYTLPWYMVSAKGRYANNVSMTKMDDGIVLCGDNLTDVTVSASNLTSSVDVKFTAIYEGKFYDSVLIYDIDENTIGIAVDTDGDGVYETLIDGSGTDILYGDVNGDGDVDMADLIRLARHLAEIELITDPALLAAGDVNGDGDVDMADLIRLARYLAEIDVSPLGT